MKIDEYEVYCQTNFLLINNWAQDFPLIKIWACQETILVTILSFEAVYALTTY